MTPEGVQPSAPLLCPACGMPISAFGGRCPSCGTELPAAVAERPRARPAARRPIGTRRSPWTPVLIGLGVAVAIGALVGGYFYLSRTSAELASRSTAPTPVDEAPPPAAQPSDPLELHNALVVARRRAQSWHADAQLVSIDVSAVDKGKVAANAKIDVEFGKSKNGQLGPRAPLTAERLVVTISRSAPTDGERRGRAAESIADPNCPLEEAWRKMVASGIPSNATVSMRYELSKRHDRAVWNATVAEPSGLSRVLDGNNCAILSR